MVQRLARVGQLDEILEVVNGCVASALVQIVYEWRAVSRHHHRVHATDNDRTLSIACMLSEHGRCAVHNEFSAHTPSKSDALTLHIGASVFPHLQRFSIITEIDADLFKNGVSIVFDETQSLIAKNFKQRDIALDIGLGGVPAAALASFASRPPPPRRRRRAVPVVVML